MYAHRGKDKEHNDTMIGDAYTFVHHSSPAFCGVAVAGEAGSRREAGVSPRLRVAAEGGEAPVEVTQTMTWSYLHSDDS